MLCRVVGVVILCAIEIGLATGQTQPEQKPPMAEKVFKNVKVLTGIPVDEFLATMGFFSASLGMTCTDCHTAESGGSWEKYADDTELKQTARRMVGMVAGINKAYFGGKREVTCYSCHRGGDRPLLTPDLAELYGPPAPPREPDALVPQASKISADQVLDKFIQAVGGAQRLGSLTSFIAKGTYSVYPASEKHEIDIFAKAPDQRAAIVHNPTAGDTITTYDGHTGWLAAPATDKPVPLLELTGGDLKGAKLDAELSFPAGIKQALMQWRVGYSDQIDGQEVLTVQGTSDGRFPVNLYFDSRSGLLLRMVRYTDSPLGLNPTQVDYSDYRNVGGVKMPFHWITTWLDGRAVTDLTEVQPNVPIDASRFAKPAATRGAK